MWWRKRRTTSRWSAPCRDDGGRRARLVVAPAGNGKVVVIVPRGGIAVLTMLAGRVVAEYDYRRPFDHGEVIETRRGYVLNTLRWLLSDMDLEVTQPIPVVV